MSGSIYGKLFQVSSWGESHGKAIGVVIDGCPAGLALTEADIQPFLNRRKPGQSRQPRPGKRRQRQRKRRIPAETARREQQRQRHARDKPARRRKAAQRAGQSEFFHGQALLFPLLYARTGRKPVGK